MTASIILLASAIPERIRHWNLGLQAFALLQIVTGLESLRQQLVLLPPRILLLDLDLPGLDGKNGIVSLRRVNPSLQIMVLGGDLSDETELDLFKAGVRGCCRHDIDQQLLQRIVVAIERGELWIRRNLTPRLLDELGAKSREDIQPRRVVAGHLASLTQRQHEIAMLVGNGESNKQIARRLAITERTVKFHLTEVFRKLGIADRLKLALLIAGSNEV